MAASFLSSSSSSSSSVRSSSSSARSSSSSSSSSSMDFAIGQVRALVRRENRAAALQLLERLARQVLPVLSKRRFRVRKLQEFFPKNANLLGMNVNRGVVIYIRLRPQHQPDTFLPYEALLETMLHELTHMVHGPHNQAFYKYLDELKEEMESLMVRGLIGSEGARFQDAGVGYSIATETSAIAVRHANDNRAAVLAAARRVKYQRLLGGVASQRLGSSNESTDTVGLTPAQLRARALEAAERRRRDNQACSLTNDLTNSIEILGIDDSSDEEQEQRPVLQRGQHVEDAITIDGEDAPTTRVSAVVDLLDDSDDECKQAPREPAVVDLTDD